MSVYVDGVDLADFGFIYSRRTGDLTPAVGRPPTVAVPGGFGERPTGADAALAPRTIQIPGTLLVEVAGQFVSAMRALGYHCSGRAGGPSANPVTVSFGAQGTTPAVQYTAYLDASASFDRADPQEVTTAGALTLVFVCPDPIATDATSTTLPLSTAARACPVGTARVRPLTVLDGPLSGAVTLALTDGAGTARGSVTLTIPATTVLTGHTVEIDHAAEAVTWVHGGTRDSRPGWLTAGDFVALDPAHATADAAALVASASEGEGDVGGTSGVARTTAFDPVWADRFATDTSGAYTAHDGTLAWQGTSGAPTGTGIMRWTVTGPDPYLTWTLPATIVGAQYPYAVFRYKVVSGSPGAGALHYATAGHGYSGSDYRSFQLTADGAWHTLALDLRQLTAGGTDWADSTPLTFKLYLSVPAVTVDLNALAIASAGPARVVGRAAPRLTLSTGTGHVTFARGWR